MSYSDTNQHISAGFQTLMDQASDTAQTYFIKAINGIDAEFGPGYAKRNPSLIAAYMRVAGDDFNQSCQSLQMQLDREQREIEFDASRSSLE